MDSTNTSYNLPLENKPNNSGKKAKLAAATIILAGILLFIGYRVYASPQKVWQRFVLGVQSGEVSKQTFNFSYQDLGKLPEASEGNFFSQFKNIKFSLKGDSYSNTKDLNNPKLNSTISYSFGSGNTTFNSELRVVMSGKEIYLNFGDNPFFSNIFSYLSPEQKVEWIKLDLKAAQDAISAQTGQQNTLDYLNNSKVYSNIFSKYGSKVLKMEDYLGNEEVRGVKTLHFKSNLDKEQAKLLAKELANTVIKSTQTVENQNTETMAKNLEMAEKVVNILIDKWEIKNLEVWLGAIDSKLYKIKLESNAPSIISLVTIGVTGSSLMSDLEDEKETELMVLESLKQLKFEGVLNYENEIYDLGKEVEVKVPENSLDVLKKLQEQQQTMSGDWDLETAQ